MPVTQLEYTVAAAFAVDVKNHQMIVCHDQGLYRHIVFQSPRNSWNNRFELITAPGSLTVTGDRDALTFRRLADMFQFFRTTAANGSRINPGYWAEKLSDHGRSVRVYSEDRLKERLEQTLADYAEALPDLEYRYQRDLARWENLTQHGRYPSSSVREPRRPRTVEEIRELIRDYDDDTGLYHEEGARQLLRELESIDVVSDTWEWEFKEWDYHFLWSLHAIAWGVAQYDAAVRAGLHKIRPALIAWDTPIPTTPPLPPRPLNDEKPAASVQVVTVRTGVL